MTQRALPIERVVVRQSEGNALDWQALRRAVESLSCGVPLVPIEVEPDGERYVITDGRHRFLAHVIAGRSTVSAHVAAIR